MTRDAHAPLPDPGPNLKTRTVAALDEALALLAQHSGPDRSDTLSPLPSIPSLLARCEAVARQAQQAGRTGRNLLICVDGLAPLAPDWWDRHAGGIRVRRVPVQQDARDAAIVEASVTAFVQGERREGRAALTVCGLANPPDMLRPFDTVRLLVCHPWTSFVASPHALTLDAHCHILARLIDRFDGVPTLQIEKLGTQQADLAAAIADSFGIAVSRRSPAGEPPPMALAQPRQGVEAVASYQDLCARFGYAPASAVPVPVLQADAGHAGHAGASLAEIERRLSQAARHTPPAVAAQVSWFLPRIAALGLPGPVTDRQGLEDLVRALDGCLETVDFRGRLDPLTEALPPPMGSLLLLLAATHWCRAGERIIAMGLVSEAMDLAPDTAPALHRLAASLYAEMGHPAHALELAAGPLLDPGFLRDDARHALLERLYGASLKPAGAHGQDLLITHLKANPPDALGSRQRRLIEIGTTREDVPGQGSTKTIAELCAQLGLDFVTVDMDPDNGRRAQRMFERNGYPFQAVCAKGETYLAETTEPLDYVFLDAYDFDHGMHSEWRQSRYASVLGSRISDAACHQMHLDCAKVLVDKLAPDGLICFDDTWRDDTGAWTAKGTTAMPFLLSHGFDILDERNRAVLLQRKTAL
jgi:hypothetical protein